MTLDKCILLRIGTLTGCPLCRESHPLCRLKNPTVISIWLLVGFHPATRSVQSIPDEHTRKRVWQYIEKERKSVYWLRFSRDQLCFCESLYLFDIVGNKPIYLTTFLFSESANNMIQHLRVLESAYINRFLNECLKIRFYTWICRVGWIYFRFWRCWSLLGG